MDIDFVGISFESNPNMILLKSVINANDIPLIKSIFSFAIYDGPEFHNEVGHCEKYPKIVNIGCQFETTTTTALNLRYKVTQPMPQQ